MGEIIKITISFEEGFCEIFNTEEDLKDYLTFAFEEYLQDGDLMYFAVLLSL